VITEVKTFVQFLAVLENAEKFKRMLRKLGLACKRYEDYCKCKERKMCNIAIAELLSESPSATLRKWRRMIFYLEKTRLIETRTVDNPANRPRRLIKLSQDWKSALDMAIQTEFEALIKRLRIDS
jgi:hypothetical protein